MGCLFAVFAGLFPRLGVLFIWLARPAHFNAAFGGSWFWPLVGIILLPFTTLMYILLWSPGGVAGWSWLWIILALFLDIGHIISVGYSHRYQLPGYGRAIEPSGEPETGG